MTYVMKNELLHVFPALWWRVGDARSWTRSKRPRHLYNLVEDLSVKNLLIEVRTLLRPIQLCRTMPSAYVEGQRLIHGIASTCDWLKFAWRSWLRKKTKWWIVVHGDHTTDVILFIPYRQMWGNGKFVCARKVEIKSAKAPGEDKLQLSSSFRAGDGMTPQASISKLVTFRGASPLLLLLYIHAYFYSDQQYRHCDCFAIAPGCWGPVKISPGKNFDIVASSTIVMFSAETWNLLKVFNWSAF